MLVFFIQMLYGLLQFTHAAGVTVSNFGLGSTFAILTAIGYNLCSEAR